MPNDVRQTKNLDFRGSTPSTLSVDSWQIIEILIDMEFLSSIVQPKTNNLKGLYFSQTE